MGVSILNQQKIKVPKRLMGRVARETLRYMGGDPKRNSLTLVLVDDGTIKGYNHRFRGEDACTDVLAFPGDGEYLGDIIISVERAREQAPRFGSTLERELYLLVIHGVLHLLGYRDYSPLEAKEMEELQAKILMGLGERGFLSPLNRGS